MGEVGGGREMGLCKCLGGKSGRMEIWRKVLGLVIG